MEDSFNDTLDLNNTITMVIGGWRGSEQFHILLAEPPFQTLNEYIYTHLELVEPSFSNMAILLLNSVHSKLSFIWDSVVSTRRLNAYAYTCIFRWNLHNARLEDKVVVEGG